MDARTDGSWRQDARLSGARTLILASLVALCGLGSALGSKRTAEACSIVLPSDRLVAATVEGSPIVAIGKFEGIDERRARFVVEQPLKGARTGQAFVLDNRGTYTASACSPYDEPFREGNRFAAGTRGIVLLEKEVDGLWQVAHLSLAAFHTPESEDEGLEGIGWYFGGGTDVRLSTIVAASGTSGPVSLFPVDRSAQAGDAARDGPWPGIALGFVFACAAAWLVVLRVSGRI